MNTNTPNAIAVINVKTKYWTGWTKEQPEPEEKTYEKLSGSKLILAEKKISSSVWSEENQTVADSQPCEYIQKDGFRLFISNETLHLRPEVTIEPLNGKIFPVHRELPLKETVLKEGDSFTVEPQTMDCGVKYEIKLLKIRP